VRNRLDADQGKRGHDWSRTKASEDTIGRGLWQVRTRLDSIVHNPRQVCTPLLILGRENEDLRFRRVSLSVLLLVIVSLPTLTMCDDRKVINIGAFSPESGRKVGPSSRSCRPASEMVFDHNNRRSDVLSGYRLNINWRKYQVSDVYRLKTNTTTQPGTYSSCIIRLDMIT
jgi:hypothetical protein